MYHGLIFECTVPESGSGELWKEDDDKGQSTGL